MDLRNIDYDLQRFRQRIFVFTVLVLSLIHISEPTRQP
jgi:hypothetical protein